VNAQRESDPVDMDPLTSNSRGTDIGRLLVSCPDQPGIVAAVAGFFSEHGANITDSQQHSTDPFGGTFFLRLEYHLADLAQRLKQLESDFIPLARRFGMNWRSSQASDLKRIAIFVSMADHALLELLWRQRAGDLSAEIVVVISNHRDLEKSVASWGVPFHHVAISSAGKADAEARQLQILGNDINLVVLARYMQVLSPRFVAQFRDRIINIHHSFLPAFTGANPYGAAHERGVKLIGATAHYVTEKLDSGPIIEQEVYRVDHRLSVEDLRRAGRHVERMALARAVTWHVEDRILVHGNKTIVFA
jgi:formyltetrahydrofolate deformylase